MAIENYASHTTAIEQRVEFELNEMQLKMIKIGGLTNIIAALLVPWILHGQVTLSLIFTWYFILVFLNIINMCFSFAFQFAKVTPDRIGPWLNAYHFYFIPSVAIIWGMIGVIFTSADFVHQLYLIIVLIAALISFALGTISDFKASVISIWSVLLPSVIYRFYIGLHNITTSGYDTHFNLGMGVTFILLGLFLSASCYVGYRLIKKSFVLTYINIELNEKLENMNKFLEDRVKERTIELEDSLKVVTYQATHDLLTDLPNKRLLLEYIDFAMHAANQNNHMFGVVILSVNEMEKIIDGLGHHAGDLVIKTIAVRFKKKFEQPIITHFHAMRYRVTLSRKDSFIILIDPVFEPSKIDEMLQPLFLIFEEPVYIEKQAIKLTASIGVSFYPKDGLNVESLLMYAGAALMQSKQQGGNFSAVYTSDNHNLDISKQIELESKLHNALKNNEFILQYQPIVNLKTGNIACVEALVRWKHPTLGMIYPDKFISLAETDGIIVPLGEWVLKTACLQTKMWHDQGFKELKVAVNLSSKQLQKQNIVETIANILKTTELAPEFVELELTESVAFQKNTITTIKKIKSLGLNLAIDDFGTGYSGLSNLKLFDIDKLKIDKSFVRDLETNDDSKAIVTNTIALAKRINVSVLAEGVENKDQLKFLQEHHCDFIQGYYFSPPIDPDTFTEKFKNFRFVDKEN